MHLHIHACRRVYVIKLNNTTSHVISCHGVFVTQYCILVFYDMVYYHAILHHVFTQPLNMVSYYISSHCIMLYHITSCYPHWEGRRVWQSWKTV